MQRLGDMLATIFGAPHTMKPEEAEERIEVLESKVESNKAALERHASDQEVHVQVESQSD